ncbi:hypothetical protein G6Y30_05890 [Staphylococcus aureus]|nr:hypothetical protein [Staphylococcus aureus]
MKCIDKTWVSYYKELADKLTDCPLYTFPSKRDQRGSHMTPSHGEQRQAANNNARFTSELKTLELQITGSSLDHTRERRQT